MLNFEQLLLGAHKLKASDIHMIPDAPPVLRINGDLKPVNSPPISGEDMEKLVFSIMPDRVKSHMTDRRGADFSYKIRNIVRFRCVAFYVNNQVGLTMRLIPVDIPSVEDLNMPEVVKEIAALHRGMILLTGVTGCGKSTTLAAMLMHLNKTDGRRIITIEDPIEFLLPSQKCIITQREIGIDIPDFMQGLRQAMRMDPDTILIGEMRDVETIRISIKAAETGHQVFSTLHTTSAVHTIQRIIGHFDESEHEMLRDQLALNLKASITQRLIKVNGGKGRRAAMEIMMVNATVSKLIHENRIADIFSVIRSRDMGMQVMDQAIADLVREGAVNMEEASKYCDDFYALKRYVAGVGSSGDAGAILSA